MQRFQTLMRPDLYTDVQIQYMRQAASMFANTAVSTATAHYAPNNTVHITIDTGAGEWDEHVIPVSELQRQNRKQSLHF